MSRFEGALLRFMLLTLEFKNANTFEEALLRFTHPTLKFKNRFEGALLRSVAASNRNINHCNSRTDLREHSCDLYSLQKYINSRCKQFVCSRPTANKFEGPLLRFMPRTSKFKNRFEGAHLHSVVASETNILQTRTDGSSSYCNSC